MSLKVVYHQKTLLHLQNYLGEHFFFIYHSTLITLLHHITYTRDSLPDNFYHKKRSLGWSISIFTQIGEMVCNTMDIILVMVTYQYYKIQHFTFLDWAVRSRILWDDGKYPCRNFNFVDKKHSSIVIRSENKKK